MIFEKFRKWFFYRDLIGNARKDVWLTKMKRAIAEAGCEIQQEEMRQKDRIIKLERDGAKTDMKKVAELVRQKIDIEENVKKSMGKINALSEEIMSKQQRLTVMEEAKKRL